MWVLSLNISDFCDFEIRVGEPRVPLDYRGVGTTQGTKPIEVESSGSLEGLGTYLIKYYLLP
jgi:hypothetical protein